jgi:hypothetical protein
LALFLALARALAVTLQQAMLRLGAHHRALMLRTAEQPPRALLGFPLLTLLMLAWAWTAACCLGLTLAPVGPRVTLMPL